MKTKEELAECIEAKIRSLELTSARMLTGQRYEAYASAEIAISNLYRALVKLYV